MSWQPASTAVVLHKALREHTAELPLNITRCPRTLWNEPAIRCAFHHWRVVFLVRSTKATLLAVVPHGMAVQRRRFTVNVDILTRELLALTMHRGILEFKCDGFMVGSNRVAKVNTSLTDTAIPSMTTSASARSRKPHDSSTTDLDALSTVMFRILGSVFIKEQLS